MNKTNLIVNMVFFGISSLSGNKALSQNSPPARAVNNIVLVHGAFADHTSWSKVIPLLQADGYNVVAVQNPLTSLATTWRPPRESSRYRMDPLFWLATPGVAR